MEFEIGGRTFEIRNEPLTEDVERVLDFDQDAVLSILDLGSISEQDKQKDITELLTQQLVKNPAKLKKYLAQQKLMEPIKTIMLCTGAALEEIKKVPLRPLYKKCKEVLGGSASDFFAELGMSTAMIPTTAAKAQERKSEPTP